MIKRWPKYIIILIILFGLAASGVFLFSKYFKKPKDSFPIPKKEFLIQGLTWRTYAYYYGPGIYKDGYSKDRNIEFIKKAKMVGANYLFLRAFYNGTKTGEVIGDDKEAEKYLRQAIRAAHYYGIKILFAPYVESRDYWGSKRWRLSERVWTQKVLKWAKFAQENKVEMFAPGVEMNLIFDKKTGGRWIKEILPKIKKVYSGKIVTAEHFDVERWKVLDQANALFGYDCLGFTVFPRKEYKGKSVIRSLEDCREYIEHEAEIIDALSKKYNIKCKLAVPIGLDFWQGGEPSPQILTQNYQIALDIFKEHNFSGVFLHLWASEPDHLGVSQDVENMLKKRWTSRLRPWHL